MKLGLITIFIISFISCSSNKDYLPEKFWGMKLHQKHTGNVARDFVNRLHFQNVATEKNEIGFYTSSVGNAVVYLSFYSNNKVASEDFHKMTQKISPENSVFVKGKFENIKSKTIYSCVGMGQVHYVFSHENILFWISADPNISRQFFEEYLNYIVK